MTLGIPRTLGLALLVSASAAPADALPLATEAVALRCTVTQSCDPAGACVPGEATHVLRLRPIFEREDGSIRLELEIDGRLRDSAAVTAAGPILWQEGRDDLQTLLVTGDDTFLWHRPPGSPGDPARLVFLTCTATP